MQVIVSRIWLGSNVMAVWKIDLDIQLYIIIYYKCESSIPVYEQYYGAEFERVW